MPFRKTVWQLAMEQEIIPENLGPIECLSELDASINAELTYLYNMQRWQTHPAHEEDLLAFCVDVLKAAATIRKAGGAWEKVKVQQESSLVASQQQERELQINLEELRRKIDLAEQTLAQLYTEATELEHRMQDVKDSDAILKAGQLHLDLEAFLLDAERIKVKSDAARLGLRESALEKQAELGDIFMTWLAIELKTLQRRGEAVMTGEESLEEERGMLARDIKDFDKRRHHFVKEKADLATVHRNVVGSQDVLRFVRKTLEDLVQDLCPSELLVRSNDVDSDAWAGLTDCVTLAFQSLRDGKLAVETQLREMTRRCDRADARAAGKAKDAADLGVEVRTLKIDQESWALERKEFEDAIGRLENALMEEKTRVGDLEADIAVAQEDRAARKDLVDANARLTSNNEQQEIIIKHLRNEIKAYEDVAKSRRRDRSIASSKGPERKRVRADSTAWSEGEEESSPMQQSPMVTPPRHRHLTATSTPRRPIRMQALQSPAPQSRSNADALRQPSINFPVPNSQFSFASPLVFNSASASSQATNLQFQRLQKLPTDEPYLGQSQGYNSSASQDASPNDSRNQSRFPADPFSAAPLTKYDLSTSTTSQISDRSLARHKGSSNLPVDAFSRASKHVASNQLPRSENPNSSNTISTSLSNPLSRKVTEPVITSQLEIDSSSATPSSNPAVAWTSLLDGPITISVDDAEAGNLDLLPPKLRTEFAAQVTEWKELYTRRTNKGGVWSAVKKLKDDGMRACIRLEAVGKGSKWTIDDDPKDPKYACTHCSETGMLCVLTEGGDQVKVMPLDPSSRVEKETKELGYWLAIEKRKVKKSGKAKKGTSSEGDVF